MRATSDPGRGLPKLRDQLARLDDIKIPEQGAEAVAEEHAVPTGLAADERNALILWEAHGTCWRSLTPRRCRQAHPESPETSHTAKAIGQIW